MTKSQKSWTVLVYLAGDNNLSEEMVWALQEMKKAASRKDVQDACNVVAQYDPRGRNPRTYDIVVDPPLLSLADAAKDGDLDQLSGSVLSEQQQYDGAVRHIVEECLRAEPPVEPGLIQSVVDQVKQVERMADTLMTLLPDKSNKTDHVRKTVGTLFKEALNHLAASNNTAAVLEAFVREQIRKAIPAENYLVVLSGHGSGAIGDFLSDSDPRSALSIPKLRQLLQLAEKEFENARDVERESRKAAERKLIDILGMDSCLMSMAELCYEIKGFADYVVGSEGFVQNTGWPYHRILESLADEPKPEDLSKTIVCRYTDFYQDYEIGGASTDISACSLKYLRKSRMIPNIWKLALQLSTPLKSLNVINELETLRKQRSNVEAEGLGDRLNTEMDTLKGDLEKTLDEVKETLEQRNMELDEAYLQALKNLIRVGGEIRERSAGALSAKLMPKGKEMDELFGDAMRRGLYQELVRERNLEGKGILTQLTKLLETGTSELEPGEANALIELRLEIEMYLLNEENPKLKEALRKLNELEAQGIAGVSKLQDGLRRLAVLRRQAALASVVDLDKQVVRKPEWIALLNSILLAHWQAQSYKGDLYTDLFDFCSRLKELLKPGSPIGTTCQDIMNNIELGDRDGKFVLKSCFSGPDFQHSHGVSVYFPWNAVDYWYEYENLQFAADTGWDEFIKAYLRASRRDRRGCSETGGKDTTPHRFGPLGHDPLIKAGTEDRIRAGTEDRIRAGTEDRIRAGTEDRIRAGTEDRIRAGTEDRIRGKFLVSSMKNPPDGFHRCKCDCEKKAEADKQQASKRQVT